MLLRVVKLVDLNCSYYVRLGSSSDVERVRILVIFVWPRPRVLLQLMQCSDIWTSTWHSTDQRSRAARTLPLIQLLEVQIWRQRQSTETTIQPQWHPEIVASSRWCKPIRGGRWILEQLSLSSASSLPTEQMASVIY